MTDQALSKQAGKHLNYLAEVKYNSPRKYKLLKEYGIQGYFDKIMEYRTHLADIHYSLTSVKKLKAFYRDMLEDEFPSYDAFINWIGNHAYSSNENMMPETFHRCEKIFDAYESYKSLHNRSESYQKSI